jgi:hypothetical protein
MWITRAPGAFPWKTLTLCPASTDSDVAFGSALLDAGALYRPDGWS